MKGYLPLACAALTACADPIGLGRPLSSRLSVDHAILAPGSAPGMDFFRPAIAGAVPLVIWLHPGGWSSGTHRLAPDSPMLQLLQDSTAIASVAYRLSTTAAFPAQINDVAAAIAWLRSRADSLGLDPARIGVWGYSSGAHLAALQCSSAWGGQVVQACVTWAAPVDFLSEDKQLIRKGYAPRVNFPGSQEATLLRVAHPWRTASDTAKAVAASPLTYITGNDPPFLIFHGVNDATVPAAQGGQLYARLTAVGVPATRHQYDVGHEATVFRSDSSIGRVRAFFRTHLR